MTARESMRKLHRLRRLIEDKERLLEELTEQRDSIMVYLSDMPRGSPDGSPVERIAIEIADLTQEIAVEMDEFLDYQRTIFGMIFRIDNHAIRRVLIMRYIDGRTYADIARELGYSPSSVYRLDVDGLRIIDSNLQKSIANESK